jgi:uncharacterized repeat protein (TIGR02543 family)
MLRHGVDRRCAWGCRATAFFLLTLVGTWVLAPVTQASAATSTLSTQGSFVTAGSAGLTTAQASLGQAGDLLVIWVKSRFGTSSPPIQVASISGSGTGAIGTPVLAIQHYTVDYPNNDDEIWYAPVTTAGTITLTFTWTGDNSSDYSEYSTQEFQPSTPSTYSVDTTGYYEDATASVTMQFPSLTPAGAGELYAGYDSNNTTGTYTTPTSPGYTQENSSDYDAILFDPDVSASTQSPYTTATAQPSTQVSIGALFVATAATTYTVTFNGNGSTGGSMSNETASAPSALSTNTFVRSGYTFSGWNTASGGTGTAYADGASYPFSAATTLYAQWTADPYTVTFNGNGSTSGSMSSETAGAPTALTANAFTRSGYTFSGWNTASGGTGTPYADGASYPFSAATTLYAQWTADPYTVTFNGNGSTSGVMANETHNAPTALRPNSFTRTGYTFSGWNTAANGTGTAYANGASYPFSASTTLYARWTAIVAHTSRILGSVVVGESRHVIIVGSGFFIGAKVTSNEPGTVVRVLHSAATEISLIVTVRRGSTLGRYTFTIMTASKQTCTMGYFSRK